MCDHARPAVADDSTVPHVRFEGVTFRYGEELPDVLCDVTFEVRPGETVALVGHSGAGKSTAVHLLMRFWDVRAGRVSVGGLDTRDLRQHDLRELVCLVPQDPYLFNTSVLENIRLARPDASDEEVVAAAELALVDEFVSDLPNGWASGVGERGAQLSGGQRQRIAIARAVLKDAPILAMDEAVSNLDAENEALLREAMDRVRRGRTTLLIAHRLSTVATADRVVVLDGGRVVETGAHAELLARGGSYALLVTAQRGGLLDVDESP